MRQNYRSDIDGFRAVAVLAVILYHYWHNLMPGGFVGVDIFFVISGYLITGIILRELETGRFSFAEFYKRRARRIFPSLLVVLVATWCAGWWILPMTDYRQLGWHTAASAAFVENIKLWLEAGYFDTAARSKPLLHVWSLSVEEQFYLIWPLLLFVLHKRKRYLLPAMLVILVASCAGNIASIKHHSAAVFYLLPTRIWELAAGGVLVYCERYSRARVKWLTPDVIAGVGLCLILASFIAFNSGQRYPGWRALLPVAGTVLLIWSGPVSWLNREALGSPLLAAIGRISYPLYLWHWPLLVLAVFYHDGPWTRPAALAASLVLSVMTYRILERPIRFGIGMAYPRLATAALAMGLFSAAGAGMATAYLDGVPERFAAETQRYMKVDYDYFKGWRAYECAVNPLGGSIEFADTCVDPPTQDPRPLVVLWGDSHASHLYPGLRLLQETERFRLGQFTGGGCPPVLDVEFSHAPGCRRMNDDVWSRLKALKPDTIILGGAWEHYDKRQLDLMKLRETIERLRSLGSRVVVFGPVPEWSKPLPTIMFDATNAGVRGHAADRLSSVVTSLALDDEYRPIVEKAGAIYVSAIAIFCDPAGCLTRTGEGPLDLTAWDKSHLTPAGAYFLVSGAVSSIIPARDPAQ